MAEKKDYSKLKKFVEAAMTNPLHPVFKAGMAKSQILQHYAVNVKVLESVKADDWFVQYPQYTEKLEAVMALCEADGMIDANADPVKEAEPVTEAFPAAAPAQGGQMDVRAMIADMHTMMSNMMKMMEQDAQDDKTEKPEAPDAAPVADKKPPMAVEK